MPERYHPGVQGPYFKDRFVYDAGTDTYLCPEGQRLPFRGLRSKNGKVAGTIPSLPCLEDRVPRLPCLRRLHQRRASRTRIMDRPY